MASQWCSALQQWTITTYFSWMKWWKHETGHHSQLLKSLLPSPHSLLWGWACTGIPLILTPDLQTPCHWEPEAGQGFGNEQTCSGVEGCTGLRWQRISQVSPYMKIRMLNRNCPRTIRKSGRITFIQLLSVFPRQNSHQKMSNALWLSSLHPWHCHQEEGLGPFSICQERFQEEQKLEISFRCLNCKFLCLKRDFKNMLEIIFAYSF